MRQAAHLHERDAAKDVLLFDAANLGKGRQLLLELPGDVFANQMPNVPSAAGRPPQKVLFRIDPARFLFSPPALDAARLRAMTTGAIMEATRKGSAPERFLAARAASAQAGRLGASFDGQNVASQLAQRLNDEPEEAVQAAIADALGDMGEAALRVLRSPRSDTSETSAASVVRDAAVFALEECNADPPEAVRTAVGRALAKCGVKK
jgi:hypothetical protein